MNEPPRSTDKVTLSGANAGVAHPGMAIVRGALYCGVVAATAVVAVMAYRAVGDQQSLKRSQDRLVTYIGLTKSVSKRLAPEYLDADGGMLADPPTAEDKLIDPQELVVAHYDGDEDDTERVNWDALQAQLCQVTGKKVVHRPYLNSADEVAAIKAGEIHVVAAHAADTPYLVNNAGFVPVAVLGSAAGASGNHLVIAVGAKSPIRRLVDMRGRELTFTHPNSITGYRAAVAVLSDDAGLLPGVDYRFHFSHGQKRSIRSLIEGKSEVVALSADKIETMLADGSLNKTDFRVIYESPIIPRLTIGYIYNLPPKLAASLTRCVTDFDNMAASGETSDGRMRFFPIDYRKDFAFSRKIDDSFDPRFGVSPNLTP